LTSFIRMGLTKLLFSCIRLPSLFLPIDLPNDLGYGVILSPFSFGGL